MKTTGKILLSIGAIALLLVTSIPRAQADITTGLVGWWKMDEASSGACTGTTADSSGGGQTGTCNNSPIYVPGKIGLGALQFNAAKPTTVTGGSSWPTTWSAQTFASWIYVTDLSTERVIFQSSDGASGWGVAIQPNGNPDMYQRGVTDNDCTSLTVSVNTWYFLSITNNGSSQTCYLYNNSGLVGTQTVTPSSALTGTGNFIIGGFDVTPSIWFTGTLDEIRVYNRALSSSDVTELYNYTPGGRGTPESYFISFQ